MEMFTNERKILGVQGKGATFLGRKRACMLDFERLMMKQEKKNSLNFLRVKGLTLKVSEAGERQRDAAT